MWPVFALNQIKQPDWDGQTYSIICNSVTVKIIQDATTVMVYEAPLSHKAVLSQ